jgi:hypothetical protein
VDGLGPVSSDHLPTSLLEDLRLAPAPDGPQRSRRPRRSGGPHGSGGSRGSGGPQGSGGPRRSRGPLVPVIVAAVLVAVVAGFVIFRGHSGTAATGSTPSTSSQDARRQAAVRLSGLLAQSVTDRAAVINAVADVRGCGPSLPQDARTLAKAASSRQRLLARLGSMPGRSELPAALLQDLAGAWQASAQVDTDLSRWAEDNIARGCHHGSRSDAGLRASYAPESQAAASKLAFARLWNPVARQYGLTTYQRNQF